MGILVEKSKQKEVTTRVLARLRARKLSREQHADEFEACRLDPIHFISHYAQTYDPRPPAPGLPPLGTIPFTLYDFQEDYIRWLEGRYQAGEDALLEKSRDMGATWCTLAWIVWHWRFDNAFQSLIGSRKEELVDNWTIDSLFGRLEHIVVNLPDWLQPEGWDKTKHRRYLKLTNPENNNAILGESANPNFARQGRYNIVLLDEFAFWDWADKVWTGTRDAAYMRVPISTAYGMCKFKRLRFSSTIPVYSLHWSKHPNKNQQWYEHECKIRLPEEVAQELDISYTGSITGRVYPEWERLPHGAFPFMPDWPVYVSWDFGIGDATALIWWQRNPATGKWRIIDCYANAGQTIDYYVPFCTGQVISNLPYDYDAEDREKIDGHALWGPAIHAGDPSGSNRNQVTGTSVIEELAKYGVYVNTRVGSNDFGERYHTTKLFLRRIEGVNTECEALDDAMGNAKFPKRTETSQATSGLAKPVHDWTSHYRTAVEYMAVNVPGFIDEGVTEKRQKSAWERMYAR